MKKEFLKIALIHLEVEYEQSERNRAKLVELNERAALNGARIIVNPEMCLSGYSFDSRSEIAPLVETDNGPTIKALAEIAQRHGSYIALGLAERDRLTDIFYNSVLLIGPDGAVIARRRKITAEIKWACPGPIHQNDTTSTPWGTIGLLICSESYYGLIPRAMAMKGVDLLLLPATWAAGNLDIKRLWRTRAMENGMYWAAVNRSGQDKNMDCRRGYSCVFAPDGRELVGGASERSRIFYVDLPLKEGRLDRSFRRIALSGRSPKLYHYLYSDLRFTVDRTPYYGLPEPGLMQINLAAGGLPKKEDLEQIAEKFSAMEYSDPRLIVLPYIPAGSEVRDRLVQLARDAQAALLTAFAGDDGEASLIIIRPNPDGLEPYPEIIDIHEHYRLQDGPVLVDFGPARIGPVLAQDFKHPELAAAISKRGGDLAVVVGRDEALDPDLFAVKSLEKIAVAAVCHSGAFWAKPPAGHDQWTMRQLDKADVQANKNILCMSLDTRTTREKYFLDRLDYDLLLTENSEEISA